MTRAVIKRIVMDTEPRLDRRRVADPHLDVPHERRLELARATSLRDNAIYEDIGSGYSRISPVDTSKRAGPK